MTIIKVKSKISKPEMCSECPFFSWYDITTYGECTGEVGIVCNISEEEDKCIRCSGYDMEDEAEKLFKNCPIISIEDGSD